MLNKTLTADQRYRHESCPGCLPSLPPGRKRCGPHRKKLNSEPETRERRFLLDGVANVIHAVLDPAASFLTDSVHTLVEEFDHLVHGKETIQTVVCKLPVETSGTRQEKINACVSDCVANASDYLSSDSDNATEACPIACTYAYTHPTHYTC